MDKMETRKRKTPEQVCENKNDEIRVLDSVTGKIFILENDLDKEKFFNLWDELVMRVEDNN